MRVYIYIRDTKEIFEYLNPEYPFEIGEVLILDNEGKTEFLRIYDVLKILRKQKDNASLEIKILTEKTETEPNFAEIQVN